MPDPTEQSRWYAEVKFVGTLTQDQLTDLCHPHTGVATMGLTGVDGVTTLRFVVDAVDISSAFMMIRSKITNGLLHRLIFTEDVLSYPVAFAVEDEARREARINVEMGLPADTPAEEVGQKLLDQIAKLPPATDEARARWQSYGQASEASLA